MLQRFKAVHYLYSQNKRGKYVAHCLDFDIVATAEDQREAERRLDVLVKFHIESYLRTNGMSGLHADAPRAYWDEYTRAKAMPIGTLRIEVPSEIVAASSGDLKVMSAKAA